MAAAFGCATPMAAIDPPESAHRPGAAFLRSHPAHLIALGFGTGLLRPGPGTWATAATWLIFAALAQGLELSVAAQVSIGVAALGLGAWAAGRAGAALGRPDAGEIVIDEVVAFWWVLVLLPGGGRPWVLQLAAFLLFRLFDIVKPVPIGWVERRWPNALGVMLDDLMAGAYALAAIELWIRLPG
jgi:phosphatidylglycerophosphatase A